MMFAKKALSALFAVLLCAGACFGAVSCAGTEEEPSATDTRPSDTVLSTETDVESESDIPISLPSDLNYGNAEINIYCKENLSDLIGEADGGTVSATVFERNAAVEDRLKVKLTMIEISGSGYYVCTDAARRLILSDDDSIDLVACHQFTLIPQIQEGLYRDVSDVAYFDWEKPWWDDEYMNIIQVRDSRYLLFGDISYGMLSNMSTFFVNKRLYEDEFRPIDDLYTDVFDGKWTWEQMTTCVSQIYRDANGNNKTDEGDILGIRGYQATPTDHLTYTAGFVLSTRDEDGNIVLIEDQTRNIEIVDALYSLIYENRGCYINLSPESYTDYFVKSFTEGETLFCSGLMSMADSFTEMTDEYAIITYPKFDELQEDYKTLVHDSATTYAISTTVKDGDECEMLAAVLEAMCYESYKRVTPAYFDVVLKSRYSSDPKSAEAIDMIRANVFTDFLYANNYSLSQPLGNVTRTIISEKNNRYASLHKSWSRLVKRDLERFNESEDE